MSLCAPLHAQRTHGWIGIQLLGGKHGGVGIEDIVPGSPAASSALARGDEVLTVDGVEVHEPKALSQALGLVPIGKPVTLVVIHDGKPHPVTLAPMPRPSDEALLRERLLDRPAPKFSLARVNGSGLDTLESHRGKPLLIDFWATWCGPCVHSLPELAELRQRWAGKLDVVGISTEPASTLLRAITELGIGHTILSDASEAATLAYGVRVLPTLVLVDSSGVVRHVEAGANVVGMEPEIRKLLAPRP